MKKQLILMFFTAVENMGLWDSELMTIFDCSEEKLRSYRNTWNEIAEFPSDIASQIIAIYCELNYRLEDRDISVWLNSNHTSLKGHPKWLLKKSEDRQKLLNYIKEM